MVWNCKQNASGKTSQTSFTCQANEKRPIGRLKTEWINYIAEDLGWNRLGLLSSKMMKVMEDRKVRGLNLEMLPQQPSRKKWAMKRERDPKSVHCVGVCRQAQSDWLKILDRTNRH